jgi:hypothetical protein
MVPVPILHFWLCGPMQKLGTEQLVGGETELSLS